MQNINKFSSRRFLLLFRQSLITNKKLIAISLAGFIVTLFVVLLFMQSITNFKGLDNQGYMTIFIVVFIFLGMMYSGMSFSAFRSKEKSIGYLLIPASNSEKYIFEFLTRIVLFILLIPGMFLLVVNVEGAIVHHYVPRLSNYTFSFIEAINEMLKKDFPGVWGIYSTVMLLLLILISTFAGACHFTKSPLVKTLFSVSGIICGLVLLMFLLFKGLNLYDYRPAANGILYPVNNKEFLEIVAIGGVVANLFLIVISWFRFKEKEA